MQVGHKAERNFGRSVVWCYQRIHKECEVGWDEAAARHVCVQDLRSLDNSSDTTLGPITLWLLWRFGAYLLKLRPLYGYVTIISPLSSRKLVSQLTLDPRRGSHSKMNRYAH